MTLELLATVVAAFFGAGIGPLLRLVTRRRAPRWIVPVLAGAGLLGMSIFMEYDWYRRLQDGLPEGARVAQTFENVAPWRPWTYLVPLIDRAIVVDSRAALRNPGTPDLVLVPVYRFGRWQETRNILTTFDCAGARRVDITEGVRFSETGVLEGGAWTQLPADDPVLRTACDGG